MNCKQGELCYVISAHPEPRLRGKFGTTVRLVTEDVVHIPFADGTGFVCLVNMRRDGPSWWLDMTFDLHTLGVPGVIKQVPIEDQYLRPIRGDLSGDDETRDRPIDTPLSEPVVSGNF